MNRCQLQRIQYVIRTLVKAEIRDAAPYVQLDALAEEVADGFAAYIHLQILGIQHAQTIEIDVPDGRWQAFKAAFGLSFRRKRLTVQLTELFPKISFGEPGNFTIDVELN